MMRLFPLFALLLVLTMSGKAQAPDTGYGLLKLDKPRDTTSLSHAFMSGEFRGNLRYFFMTTNNEERLRDYYANAIGAGIRFETAKFHNFQFAIGSSFIFNVGSSNLTLPDTLTGYHNRYEIGLYDITNPSRKQDINRLDELYLKYNLKHSFIILGRQFINLSFINLQDGRMNTTAVEGILAEMNEMSTLKFQLGWFWSLSPRSTTGWYKIGESVGIYPPGINPDGTKSQYTNNIKSSGIAILGITKAINRNIKLHISNMFTDRVFNTVMIQTDISMLSKKSKNFFVAAQIIKQDALNSGGNNDQAKTYFAKGSHSLSFGASFGWKDELWGMSVNYNRITGSGRYLVPREWGREPFFTFLHRERNEGTGDVNAFMTKVSYHLYKGKLLTSFAAGYYKLPDVKDFALNKYGLPSYIQLNADLKYNFKKIFKGLEAEILVINKINCGETYDNKKFIFNKVNMLQYNFVLNYRF
jgi:hypothetical protein